VCDVLFVGWRRQSPTADYLHGEIRSAENPPRPYPRQVEIAIVRYEEATNGVLVTTQDGTTHHGHILVGADGIHSRLR
jgi:2-polyprenyl-6-methoxyphenol hydroxylase-like FAD-dependent oxidoreductase